jgi:pimeloyl-ACP methyl ester carboxylesterase
MGNLRDFEGQGGLVAMAAGDLDTVSAPKFRQFLVVIMRILVHLGFLLSLFSWLLSAGTRDAKVVGPWDGHQGIGSSQPHDRREMSNHLSGGRKGRPVPGGPWGDTMRLAAKWRGSWKWETGFDSYRVESVRTGGEWVDVMRLGRGDPLVIVPGLAGGWKLLWPLAAELARDFEVFVTGLRGDRHPWAVFDGGPGRTWEMRDYAEDLSGLIDRLGLSCPSVLGVSFGGAIALELATQYPERLGALVVHGAESRFRPTLGSTIARRVLERFPLPRDSGFVNQFFHLLYGKKPEPGPLVDFVIERIWETDQSVMARRLAQLESFDVSDQLWRIDAPTLVIAGGRDVVVPAARQRAMAEAIPGARFKLVEEAGHIGFLTHRTEVVRSVKQHLRRVKAMV